MSDCSKAEQYKQLGVSNSCLRSKKLSCTDHPALTQHDLFNCTKYTGQMASDIGIRHCVMHNIMLRILTALTSSKLPRRSSCPVAAAVS